MATISRSTLSVTTDGSGLCDRQGGVIAGACTGEKAKIKIFPLTPPLLGCLAGKGVVEQGKDKSGSRPIQQGIECSYD
jgi:hypothetical protein